MTFAKTRYRHAKHFLRSGTAINFHILAPSANGRANNLVAMRLKSQHIRQQQRNPIRQRS